MHQALKRSMQTAVMIALYLLLANARSVQPNPFIPGANLAFHMIVVVIAGILFGPLVGAFTGLLGTGINVYMPAGNTFELAAIMPHTLMGLSAGLLSNKQLIFSGASIIVGHALNMIVYLTVGIIHISLLLTSGFWLGLGYEILVGYLSIIVIVTIYNIAIGKRWH